MKKKLAALSDQISTVDYRLQPILSRREQLSNAEMLKKRKISFKLIALLFELLPRKIKERIIAPKLGELSLSISEDVSFEDFGFLQIEALKQSIDAQIDVIKQKKSILMMQYDEIKSSLDTTQHQVQTTKTEIENARLNLDLVLKEIEKIEEKKRANAEYHFSSLNSNLSNSPDYLYYKDLYE